jgi:hypothetical protein
VVVTHDVDFDEYQLYKGYTTSPQFDVEKLMELRPTYSVFEP